jgi:hypothetical protein
MLLVHIREKIVVVLAVTALVLGKFPMDVRTDCSDVSRC